LDLFLFEIGIYRKFRSTNLKINGSSLWINYIKMKKKNPHLMVFVAKAIEETEMAIVAVVGLKRN